LPADIIFKLSGVDARVSELSPEEFRDFEMALKKVGERAAALIEQS